MCISLAASQPLLLDFCSCSGTELDFFGFAQFVHIERLDGGQATYLYLLVGSPARLALMLVMPAVIWT